MSTEFMAGQGENLARSGGLKFTQSLIQALDSEINSLTDHDRDGRRTQ